MTVGSAVVGVTTGVDFVGFAGFVGSVASVVEVCGRLFVTLGAGALVVVRLGFGAVVGAAVVVVPTFSVVTFGFGRRAAEVVAGADVGAAAEVFAAATGADTGCASSPLVPSASDDAALSPMTAVAASPATARPDVTAAAVRRALSR